MQQRKNNVHEFPRTEGKHHRSQDRYSFACSDVGYPCDWHADAATEDELMKKVEEHGREAHNFQKLSDQKRFKLRNNIQRAA